MKTLLTLCVTALLALSCGKSHIECVRVIADATIAALDTVQTKEGYKQVRARWKVKADAWGKTISIQDVDGAKVGTILMEVHHAFRKKELQFLGEGVQRIFPDKQDQKKR